ncbi:NRPS1, partial [Symbiodinium pilosum]
MMVVPVDVAWPQERIKQAALDSDVAVALVEPSSLSLLPELPCPSLVVDAAFYEKYAAEPELCQMKEEDAALVLFTSGSTGKPKGIVLSHGYVTALVAGIVESKRMSQATKTLCYHSPTWMPFLDNLFGPLLAGGTCLYFPDNEKHIVMPS